MDVAADEAAAQALKELELKIAALQLQQEKLAVPAPAVPDTAPAPAVPDPAPAPAVPESVAQVAQAAQEKAVDVAQAVSERAAGVAGSVSERAADVAEAVTERAVVADAAPQASQAADAIKDAISMPALPEAFSLPDALPSLPFSLPPLPLEKASALLDSAAGLVEPDMLPIVAISVLLPLTSFALLLAGDLLTALLSLFGRTETTAPESALEPEGGSVGVPSDTIAEEGSVWPALLQVQRSLEALPPEEQRRIKLETGTNWPPRTTTERPFDDARAGFTFFQGPTPLTAVQEGLPSFFSKANFEGVAAPTTLKLLGALGGASLLVVLFILLDGSQLVTSLVSGG